jgi:hypothetical protein
LLVAVVVAVNVDDADEGEENATNLEKDAKEEERARRV